jgi:hypothetical protein
MVWVAVAALVSNANVAQANPDAPDSTAAAGEHSRLPFMADEARKRGHVLPLPYGVSLVVIGLGNREIEVTDVRVGVRAQPPQSVSDFLELGSTSDVFNANIKLDVWLLPFLNVYALLGYVHNESSTHAVVTLDDPGPPPGVFEYETDIETELDGAVGGLGFTLAAGYPPFFSVLDVSYARSDLGFDNDFTALISTVRLGWDGRIGELPAQLWLGAGDWDTAATATGHTTLPNGAQLDFEADQEPVTNWLYDVGGNLQFSRKFHLVADVGVDFNGGYVIVLVPTYRFGK